MVAQYRTYWDQDPVYACSRSSGIHCSALPHPRPFAPSSCWGLGHHSTKHVPLQRYPLSQGKVRPCRAAGVGQPAVLHQFMGHDMADRLPGGGALKQKTLVSDWFQIYASFRLVLKIGINPSLHSCVHALQHVRGLTNTCIYNQILQ